MQNTPEISIVVPVYNMEKYLTECLSSILSQTYANIEVICVNDGSTDGSAKILQEFAEQDSRIRIITQNNSGVAIARNVGLETARGKYVYFVDSDDTISPSLCELCQQTAETNNSDMVMILFKKIDHKLFQSLNLKDKDPFLNYNDKSSLLMFQLNPFRFFFKREFLLSNRIMFPCLRFCEDMVFNIKAILLAESVQFLDKYLYYYRTRPGSAISPESLKKNKPYLDMFIFHREVKFLFDKQEYLPCLSYVYDRLVYPGLCRFYFDLSKGDKKKWIQKFNCVLDERDIQYLKLNKRYGSTKFHGIYYWHFYRQFWGTKIQQMLSWFVVKCIRIIMKVSDLRTFCHFLNIGKNIRTNALYAIDINK